MIQITTKFKLRHFAVFVFGLFACLLFCQNSCFAKVEPQGITEQQLDMFAANNIMFYNPGECMRKTINATSCFKIDTSVDAMDNWYAEGCLNNGECTAGVYASVVFTNGYNSFLLSDTKVDEEMGGMQYIYAENYDVEFNGYENWIAKFTPNGGNSTQKYYWIVLPDQAYTTAFGETYVATFENYDEPVYFITYDAHACPHQSQHYCEQAEADPDGTAIGPEFFGAFTKNGGNYTEVANKLGKLKSFCRINGNGEVTVHESGTGSVTQGSSQGSSQSTKTNTGASNTDAGSNSTSSSISGSDITWIGDSYSCGALSIIKEKFSGISFGGSECDANSYIMSNKGVGDRYGGGTSNPPALTILKRVADAGDLKSYLVMAVGTNAGWDDNEVNQLKEIMASHPDTKVILVTAKAKAHLMSDDNGTNDRLKALADSEENYYLADWAAAYDESYFAENSTHPTANGGYEKWVEVIAGALSGVKNDCTSHEGDYPQYYQGNYENSDHENAPGDWTGISYDGGTVADSGCGAVSMAMLATVASGKDVYPQDIIEITAPNNYVYTSPTVLDPLVGEKYGFEVIAETYSSKSEAYDKMKDYLNRGYMIHLSGDGFYEGLSTYDTAGHYIGVFSIDSNDQVWIANSATENSQRSLQSVVDFIHNGEFTAIKGGGGTGDSCLNYCTGGNNRVGETGLTFEQAKTFMMHYGENKNGSSEAAVGALWNFCNGGGSNCVTFSAFFMYKFTDIPNMGPTGNGNEVVDTVVGWNVGATRGTEPQVYAILSTDPIHTAVVLGHHDGKWIIGHASCNYEGRGIGNGGNGLLNGPGDSKGGGSGFVALEESDNPDEWQWMAPGVRFAYPREVYVDKIEEYLNSGV